jgi:Na+/H+ antiporter NhaD/arsenite permease-like protein
MTFGAYLVSAMPPTLVALAVLLACVVLVVRPGRELLLDPTTTRLSIAIMQALHRNVRVDWKRFSAPVAALGAMLVAWTVMPSATGVTPELICWIGVIGALSVTPSLSERLLRGRVEVESVIFLLSLFIMVGGVRRTGLFEALASWLTGLEAPPSLQLILFLAVAGIVTGLFSAGPSMAAMLDVAEHLARRLPPTAVYVGLALAVCAGSSLFLTAATSGPLAQALAERADLRDEEGERLRFGFFEFLPVGLVSFAIIMSIAMAFAFVTS